MKDASFEIQTDFFSLKKTSPLTLIAGPCVIESLDLCLSVAEKLLEITQPLGIQLVFKSSFDKANRSSIDSFRGPGIDEGLKVLAEVKKQFNVPIFTDIHLPKQAEVVAEICDFLQIPAFLCRQTDLLVAAGNTGKIINVKKGQFLAPWDMKNIVRKIESTGNHNIILTDRGTSFGYNNLVSDFRCIPIMQELGYPVCFDATHSVQLPGGRGDATDGQREFIPTLAKAAIAAGADLLYMETHPDPENGLCDQASMMPLAKMPKLLKMLKEIYELVRQ